MTLTNLVQRNLAYFRRTNLAVILGVATAVSVLAGALLVGDSVRGSLRGLALARLGATDWVLAGKSFFRAELAADLQAHARFAANFQAAVPLIALEGVVTRDENRARAGGVQVYGVDARFWQFHNVAVQPPEGNEALVSPALAAELGAKAEETLLLRIEKPSAIPVESLHGRKDDLGRSIRVTMRGALPPASLGEFSLRPQQGAVRAIFLPLAKLQRNLEQDGRANAILFSARPGAPDAATALPAMLRETFRLADLGLKLRALREGATEASVVSLESERAVIEDALAEKARGVAQARGLRASEVLTYLANSIRAGGREVPYSLVAALDAASLQRVAPGVEAGEDGIVLNQWAAADLGVKGGEEVELEYYLWKEEGRLTTEKARFRLRGVAPMAGAALDRNFSPDYPGITDTESLADWDPPFPIDLGRVRPKDEDYWRDHRTTPKAFLPLAAAQKLWATRYGSLTSIRYVPAGEADLVAIESSLRDSLDPLAMGLEPQAVREASLQASRGATDFGEYFTYFSFFLVVSALLLTTLFFRLGIEQRLREIGLLRSVGYSTRAIRGIFLREGLGLAAIGSLAGAIGAIGYGALMMWGLRTWWVGAVGTTELRLHVAPLSLLIGAASGIAAAMLCVWWTLRRLATLSPRSLLGGRLDPAAPAASQRRRMTAARWAIVFAVSGLGLLAAAAGKAIGQAGGFFGAGTLLLVAALCLWAAWLRRDKRRTIAGQGFRAVSRLGFRSAALRPGRSVLCIALIAASAFIIVSVDAFRRAGGAGELDRHSGTGGYALMAESLLPLVHDPNSEPGREELNLRDGLAPEVAIARFRLRPGDDASCLNLYQPRNPRILGATTEFLRSGRFAFQSSLAATEEEKGNPWLLLDRPAADGAIPVAADANSMTYVLHAKLGDVLTVASSTGAPVRMRLVAALADSVFQGELLMAERHFVPNFPAEEGYRVFLIDAPPASATSVAALLEERLDDFGFDAVSTDEKLAAFHQVENTYLSTFQTLGGLGLLLGTIGLGAVLLRNVLERRRELALLRAVGFRSRHLSLLVLAENALLLGCGLLTGVVCALLAILPALQSRGGRLSLVSLGLLLLAVLATGFAASIIAVRAAVRAPLIPSLRAE